jgi:hypothetical protein
MATGPVLVWLSAVILSAHNVPSVRAEDCNEVQLNKAKLRYYILDLFFSYKFIWRRKKI